MQNISISSDTASATFYAELTGAARALTDGEPDLIANMANISALIWQYVPDLNWAGFYRAIDGELVLGPFQGKTACIRIAMGKGVCGTAAQSNTIQRVGDVLDFPGHIACDADSRSELVIPFAEAGKVRGVLDLDSPLPDRFSQDDETGLKRLVDEIAGSLV